MARIEWAALSGQEVETVVSILLFNEHPRATRIRPSQGDFGIDVLVPHPADASLADVYQIKKFAVNLDDSQKRQIQDSFQRVLVGLIRRGVPLADWYLVMPLDPTVENALDWFAEMPDAVIARMSSDAKLALTAEEKATIKAWHEVPARIIEWKGLTYCEALASKFWFVADYYLHGGSERIKSAVTEVAKILQRDVTLPDAGAVVAGSSIVEPGELREHLGRLGRVLDGDPHFRYGVSVYPVPPQLPPEPGLIAAAQEVAPDGMCITFRIYARFAEAVNERPIPIKVRFQFEPASAEQQAFDDWRKYGKPLTAVVGIDSDLPGGLGGSFDSATARISPADGGKKGATRYRIVAPDGAVAAELRFSVTTTTGLDGTGLYVQGRDASGLVSIEGQLDMDDRSGKIGFSFGDPTGREAAEVAAAIEFAASLSQPNRLQIAGKHGPFHDLQNIPEAEAPLPPFVARYIAALAALQPHTPTAIVVPDLTTVTGQLAHEVLTAAKLLDGQTIVGTWKPFEFETDGNAAIDTNGHYQLATIEPLTVVVGEEALTLGAIQNTLLSANLTDLGGGQLRAEPHLSDTGQQAFAPDEPTPPADRGPVRSRPAPTA
ncbi:hypothetical protein GCM10009555_061150 [Acrocarpospora macrocephala]|uniref:Restriction endonuclease type IV Mrr domain-containing protein n=1 Tax=Acrocarpospora macrocephala TaxID=150177 RepID=A0A5M3WN24_9ACTN|nr:hypothetical protein [Acrocarpospora macrocephala]GES09559.1 hypothetical protein Amac_031550 [Acrocarpospora macrocephala]